jgi:hypothetical protein
MGHGRMNAIGEELRIAAHSIPSFFLIFDLKFDIRIM